MVRKCHGTSGVVVGTHSSVVNSLCPDKTLLLFRVEDVHVRFCALQALLFTHTLGSGQGLLLCLF
jgi:hypothetical protein